MDDTAEQRRKRTLVYAIPFGILTAGTFVGVTFMPYLLAKAPLVLVLLSPLFRHLVLVSPSVDAASLFAVAVPRHFAPDPFAYLIARDYGPLAVSWIETNSPTTGKFIRVVERLFAKVGVLALLVSPDPVVSALAGAARVPFALFVAFNLAGTVGMVTVARLFGEALEKQITAIVAFFQAHLLEVTLASVVLVLAVNWLSQRKKRAATTTTGADT